MSDRLKLFRYFCIMLENKKIRIARPSSNLEKTAKFYCNSLGFELIGGFEDHDGFDGIMVGHADQPYHLEFTKHRKTDVAPSPTPEDLLVFYVPNSIEWKAIINAIEASGAVSSPSHNPYWDQKGKTFSDPDGYRIVIQNSDWG